MPLPNLIGLSKHIFYFTYDINCVIIKREMRNSEKGSVATLPARWRAKDDESSEGVKE